MRCYHRKYLPILLMSSMHCEMWGNCSIFLHFLLLPLLLSEPPEKHGGGRAVVTLTFHTTRTHTHTLTLSRFQINCVCDDIFQFHEFQLGCFECNPAVRADFDPFPLITPPGDDRESTQPDPWSVESSTAQHTEKQNQRAAHPHKTTAQCAGL